VKRLVLGFLGFFYWFNFMVIGKYSLDSSDKVFFYFLPKRVRKMKIILFAFAFRRGWRNRDLGGILSIEFVNQIDLVFLEKRLPLL